MEKPGKKCFSAPLSTMKWKVESGEGREKSCKLCSEARQQVAAKGIGLLKILTGSVESMGTESFCDI